MCSKVINYLISIIIFIFGIYLFSNILPENNMTHKNLLQDFSPQGFGFYSKSPRDEQYILNYNKNIDLPNFQPKNIFGLKRKGRAQAIELGRLDAKIKDNQWYKVEHEKEINKKVQEIKNVYKVKKDEKFKNIDSGTYIIIKKEPISWYFRDFKDTTSQNIKIAKVVVYD